MRPGGLFYIKVYEKTAMKKGAEHKSRSQGLVNSPGRFMINNEDWKLKTGCVTN